MVSFLVKQDLIQPNHLTYFRFFICVVLLFFFPHLSYVQILLLAALGISSDFFDGALARAASKKTRLGMMIDPLADKTLAITLIYILLARKVISPVYLILMLLMEAHLVLIPILSWSYGRCRKGVARGVFVVRPKEILMGKIKVFLYAFGFMTILMARAVGSVLLLKLAEWILISGIAAGAIALLTYLFRWYMRPYRIS